MLLFFHNKFKLKFNFVFIYFLFFTKIKLENYKIMKKFSCLFIAVLAIFTSCSKDDLEATEPDAIDSNPNGKVLKKMTVNLNGGAEITTEEYFYNANKLAKITSSDDKNTVFTYTGNLITKKEFYSSGALNTTEIFEYNPSNQLVNFKRVNPSNKTVYRGVYVYNPDGTITATGYKGDLTDQKSQISNRKVFIENAQISKIETYETVNGTPTTETTRYTFDSKSTPFINILGFDKLTYYDSVMSGNAHNIIGSTSTNSTNSKSDNEAFDYAYNKANLPISSSENNAIKTAGGSIIFQYFYE